jgi:glutamate-1-semialdehyde 2,1-aminomutase
MSVETATSQSTQFTARPEDRELFDKHLRSFVPADLFDVHNHLYRVADFSPDYSRALTEGPPVVGYECFQNSTQSYMGDRAPKGGLFFPFPEAGLDFAAANDFLANDIADQPGSRGLMMIHPDDDPDAVEATVKEKRFAGFKVYHTYSGQPVTFDAPTETFLPEWAWEIADRHGLAIMLHMVKEKAFADPANQKYIVEHCRKYSGANLILAHAARGFCYLHTTETIHLLKTVPNVYFDTSAVGESEALQAIIETCGPRRLMYGSDFPVSEMPGRSLSVGDGFVWIYEGNSAFEGWTLGQPPHCGIQCLLALRQAARSVKLRDSDMEWIFGKTARQLLGIEPGGTGEIGKELYEEAKRLIPGGGQLFSKRPELAAPEQWPPYYSEARGCEIIDVDGRRFLDFASMGILHCVLGYNDPDVTAAVIRRVQMGATSTLYAADEVEVAKLLLGMHPWAENVRYTRAGGEAVAVAVRIARTATGRDRVAICGYHGWSDWYLAANIPFEGGDDALAEHLKPDISSAGVPKALAGTSLAFGYNKLDQLKTIVSKYGKELAAVVMEPVRSFDPEPGFLEGVRQLCDECGARLIFDEVSAGFRLTRGGAHLKYGVIPDVAVFAKTIGNGHPMAAVIGKASTMQAVQESFVSSSFWTEGVGPAAAVATLKKMNEIDVAAYVHGIGVKVRDGALELAKKHGLPMKAGGFPAMLSLSFDHEKALELSTMLTSRMLKRGVLFTGSVSATMAHEDSHIGRLMEALDPAMGEVASALERGTVEQEMGGPVKHRHFVRLA